MDKISIQFSLFSAFYSPLISTMSGGFLQAEGLDPQWSISPPGSSALAALKDGSAHVVQSALSQGFTSLNQGETPAAVHFAQVNEMDGFEALAEKATLSVRHFSRRFEAATGQTAGAYAEDLRLGQGRNRLAESRSSIATIAASVGFASADSFRRAFERRYGISPTSYRMRFSSARMK